jgi:hypothetical protein
MSKNRTLALDHFTINLQTHQSSEDHSNCSVEICAAYQLDPKAYTMPHLAKRTSSCQCTQLKLDSDVSSAILMSSSESFPVIKLSRADINNEASTFVKALNSSEVENYVAISHVWSHGLGNPRENALPRCRLQQIQALVNDLAPLAGIKSDAVPFWMDTLCCPLLPKEFRRTAILRMAKTYERSSCVLVLDRNLYSVDTNGISKLEVIMQIFRTTWMQRLWTLQEAKLAKNLWFQFKNEAVNLERMLDGLVSEPKSLTEKLFRVQFRAILRAKYTGLRERYNESDRALDIPASDACYRLISLAFSLSGRSTSWATDEAICMVNLLGLDLAPILDISTEDASCATLRMREMWKQWTAVPLAIIFNRAPRLPYKGFRWAQSTFVRTQKWAVPLVEVNQDAILDPGGQGLLVTPSSFILQNKIPLILMENNIRSEREVDSKWEKLAGSEGLQSWVTFLIADYATGYWYDVQFAGPIHDLMPEFDRDDQLAIIYTNDRTEANANDRHTPGLLVSMRNRDMRNGISYVTSLYHVSVARQESASEKLFKAGLQVKQILQGTPALCGRFENGKAVTGPDSDPNNPEIRFAMAKCNFIARVTLDKPDVKAYLMTSMAKNQDPSTLAWRTATEEQRRDWNFRVDHGDVGHFYNNTVNFWLNIGFTPAMPVPRGMLTYCVD